jgi:hypothetical protein
VIVRHMVDAVSDANLLTCEQTISDRDQRTPCSPPGAHREFGRPRFSGRPIRWAIRCPQEQFIARRRVNVASTR